MTYLMKGLSFMLLFMLKFSLGSVFKSTVSTADGLFLDD